MEQLMRCVLLVTLVSALWACPSSGGEAGYTDGSTPSEPRTVGDDPEPGEEEVVDEPICTPSSVRYDVPACL